MVPFDPLNATISLTLVVCFAAVIGSGTGCIASLLFGSGFEASWRNALLGAASVILAFVPAATRWPSQFWYFNGKEVSSIVLKPEDHYFQLLVIFAVLLPLLHEFYRSRRKRSRIQTPPALH
jgi:hypothetical protein